MQKRLSKALKITRGLPLDFDEALELTAPTQSLQRNSDSSLGVSSNLLYLNCHSSVTFKPLRQVFLFSRSEQVQLELRSASICSICIPGRI
jgi:hypothetical protein